MLTAPAHESVLVVSATKLEVEPLIQKATSVYLRPDGIIRLDICSVLCDLLITGVGIPSAMYCLASFLAGNKVPFAFHLGIAGSYRDEILNGSVVSIVEEEFGDIGIDQGLNFSTLFESGLAIPDKPPFKNGKLIHLTSNNILVPDTVKNLKGLTINMVTSNYDTIRSRIDKFDADVETMENAAYFYVCLKHEIPFLSLRGISNKVGESDRSRWLISDAVQNACNSMIEILQNNFFHIHEA